MIMFRAAFTVVLVSVCWTLVYKFLIPSLPPVWGGFTHTDFQHVEDIFRQLIEDGRLKGGAVAAYYKGEVIVDLWGGYADLEARRPWKQDTVTVFYSTTKLIGAVVIAQIVQRGLLDYKKPVSHYWPEFGQNGKDKITVEMLLSHQGGLAVPDGSISVLDLLSHVKIEEFLVRQKPRYTPGSRFGYHGLTWGLYVDTLARKVDPKHRNMSQIFQDDIAVPFGIDFFVGLPKSLHHRMARVYPMTVWQAFWLALTSGNLDDIWRFYLFSPLSKSDWVQSSRTFKELLKTQYFINDPDLNAVGVTSYSGQGTARGMAKFCSVLANGGSYNENILISPKLITRLGTPHVEGFGETIQEFVRFGPGTFLSTNPKSQTILGHPGYGGQIGFADPNIGLSFAFCTNHLTNHHFWTDPVLLELQNALYEELYKRKEKLN